MAVTHSTVATLPDEAGKEVNKAEWNDAHVIGDGSFVAAKLSLTATDVLLGRSTAGAGNGEEIACTAAGRAILDDASAAAQRTTLGLVIGTNVQAWDAQLDDIAALAVTDGNIIVGDGLNWVAESGATARTSLGLGTGDSPQFTGIELGHATDTTITRASAGNLAIEGNLVYRAGGTDVPVADGGTGSSTAADARTALGLVIGTDVQAQDAGLQQIADLADPNADRILFWDDSAGAYTFLTVGTGLSITTTTISSTAGTLTITQRVYTSSDTWSKPAGLTYLWVRCQAPGGGGGGADGGAGAGASVGGGGGGGGYGEKFIAAASLGATETVTIGSVGAAGTASGGGTGGTGGTTSFGAHVSCTGGVGGTGDASPNTGIEATAGGAGGVGSSGDVNIAGGGGGTGHAIGTSNVATGGIGGNAKMGGGAVGIVINGTASTAGNTGGNYGGGGSGAALNDSVTDSAGGAGGAGIIIVWEIGT